MRLLVTSIIVVSTATSALAAGDVAFPPFDSSTFVGQLFWLAITFGTLYLLMSRIALPRIGTILEERRETIDAALAAAATAQQGAEDAAIAHEQSLTKARANAQAIALEARAKSAKEMDTERHSVEKDLSAKLSAAEVRILDMKTKAMSNVGDIAKDATTAIIEQLTGKIPTADEVAQAITAARGK